MFTLGMLAFTLYNSKPLFTNTGSLSTFKRNSSEVCLETFKSLRAKLFLVPGDFSKTVRTRDVFKLLKLRIRCPVTFLPTICLPQLFSRNLSPGSLSPVQFVSRTICLPTTSLPTVCLPDNLSPAQFVSRQLFSRQFVSCTICLPIQFVSRTICLPYNLSPAVGHATDKDKL